MAILDAQQIELLVQLAEVVPVAADAAAGAGDDGGGVLQREVVAVLRVGGVGREHQRLDSALRGVQRQQGRAVAAADHLAPPQQARFGLDQRVVNAEHQAVAGPSLAPQREHQTGAFGRAPADRGGQRKAACKTVEPGPAHFAEVDAGVPHQRAITKHPEVFTVAPGQHGLARTLDLLVGQAPVGRQALLARLRVPGGQHLIGQAQPGSVRRRQPARQLGKVREGSGRHGPICGRRRRC